MFIPMIRLQGHAQKQRIYRLMGKTKSRAVRVELKTELMDLITHWNNIGAYSTPIATPGCTDGTHRHYPLLRKIGR